MKRKKILISPNSFKECANSVTIAKLIESNLSELKNTDLIVKPISDGGDGFLNVCKFYFNGEIRSYSIITAINDSRFDCPVLFCQERGEIYVESAEVLGLKVVPQQYRNPLKLSSRGLGELLLKIDEDIREENLNVRKVLIGIGGTATIDMGIGMMSELGLKLYDSSANVLNVIPENFAKTSRVNYTPISFPFEIIPIVDVGNPLFCADSGIMIYGKQKGATGEMISQLIKGFNNFINILKNSGLTYFTKSLSGAGGGIPAAFQLFNNSSILSSKDFLQYTLGFSKFGDKIDYLITGEGAYDMQTGFGKGAGILIDLFKPNVDKIFLVCGSISKETIDELPEIIHPIELQSFFENRAESIENYEIGLQLACSKIRSEFNF